MINQLIDIISREALLFESFLDLLEQQKTALVANNLSELNRLTRLQQEALVRSRSLDDERVRVVAAIKAERRFDGDLTVSRIIEISDSEQAHRLIELRELLLGLNEKILEVRNTNAFLINESRELISRTMTMLSRGKQSDATYTRDAAHTDRRQAVALDRRI
jgi:hypothetical protein